MSCDYQLDSVEESASAAEDEEPLSDELEDVELLSDEALSALDESVAELLEADALSF